MQRVWHGLEHPRSAQSERCGQAAERRVLGAPALSLGLKDHEWPYGNCGV